MKITNIGEMTVQQFMNDLHEKQDSEIRVDSFSRDMAAMLQHNHEDFAVRQLHLEWMIDYWGMGEMKKYVPIVDRCYDLLAANGQKIVLTNDLDSKTELRNWGDLNKHQVFTHEDQNYNFVFVRTNRNISVIDPTFTIYEYRKESDYKKIEKNKGSKYPGWVYGMGSLGRPEHGLIHNYASFTHALFCLECLERELTDEETW